jgi:hypothetical protein
VNEGNIFLIHRLKEGGYAIVVVVMASLTPELKPIFPSTRELWDQVRHFRDAQSPESTEEVQFYMSPEPVEGTPTLEEKKPWVQVSCAAQGILEKMHGEQEKEQQDVKLFSNHLVYIKVEKPSIPPIDLYEYEDKAAAKKPFTCSGEPKPGQTLLSFMEEIHTSKENPKS